MKLSTYSRLAFSFAIAVALTFSPLLFENISGVDLGTQVQAKSDNSGGKGKSKGKSKSKNKSDRGNSQNSNSEKHLAKTEKLKGSLNAAHASEQAKAHAAPHSRVGLVSTYEKAITASGLSDEDASQITDLLSQLEDPELTNKELHELQAELAAIVNELEEGETTEGVNIDTLAEAALATLKTASNKPIDEDGKMIDAVNSLLDIDENNIVAERVKTLNAEPADEVDNIIEQEIIESEITEEEATES